MPSVVLDFYEKPGCINNRKQRSILEGAGFQLRVHNLLTHPWQADELRAFFTELPLPQWFNPSAPRIKQERIKPFLLTETQALSAMLEDPLLIRRPLIQCGAIKGAGFDLNQWLPLLSAAPDVLPKVPEDIEQCPRSLKQPGSPPS
ncbi:MAG: ArsC/Spx/MgsR family protein [Pseudomonadota bacterium]|nr:hypothetical protein [Pseudomonadales bacterium]MDY6921312.1 ArsC/Spx/MgsR family protein [Pseudomonadota bacterium]